MGWEGRAERCDSVIKEVGVAPYIDNQPQLLFLLEVCWISNHILADFLPSA